jgi:HPt (histidine-containing phosphotransfer) domain-containing protein
MTNSEHASIEQYVNMPELLARVDNDSELLTELFELFQEDFPKLREDLDSAVRAGDLRQAEKAAHALKGMLANLSMKHGAVLAANMEAAARAGDEVEIQQAMAAFNMDETGLLAAVGRFMAGGEP